MPTIIKQGDCCAGSQRQNSNVVMEYTLSDDGVLTIRGNDILEAKLVGDWDEPDGVYPESQFKDMDFHTVVVEEGVWALGEMCFLDCKNLRHVKLAKSVCSMAESAFSGCEIEDDLSYLETIKTIDGSTKADDYALQYYSMHSILYNDMGKKEPVEGHALKREEVIHLIQNNEDWEVNGYDSFIESLCNTDSPELTKDDLIRRHIRTFKLKNYNIGFALTSDEEQTEILAIHNNTNTPRIYHVADYLVPAAIRNGGNGVRHFDGVLSMFYERFGFVEYKRERFCEQFAPKDWDYEKEGRPNIVYRKLENKDKESKPRYIRTFALFTDDNPEVHEELSAHLVAGNYLFHITKNENDSDENKFVIFNVALSDVQNMAKKYKQDCFIFASTCEDNRFEVRYFDKSNNFNGVVDERFNDINIADNVLYKQLPFDFDKLESEIEHIITSKGHNNPERLLKESLSAPPMSAYYKRKQLYGQGMEL